MYTLRHICHGKFRQDCFLTLSGLALSSNFKVIACVYVLIAGNESEKTWSRAFDSFHRKFPFIGRLTTVVIDGDNIIALGLTNAFPASDRPVEVGCPHHRRENLCKYGKDCTKVFHKLLQAHLVSDIVRIKSGSDFASLSAAAQVALLSIPDSKQFQAAAVLSGATLYGKNSSHTAEVANKAIKPGRRLDPMRAALWHVYKAARLYHSNSHSARSCTNFQPPRICQRLLALCAVEEVHLLQIYFTAILQVFIYLFTFFFCKNGVVFKIYLRIPVAGSANKSRF